MKTTSVTTLTQLNEALQDTTVQRIRLLNDITGDLTLTRKVDLALNGFKVTGNVGINHNEAGTVTIEAGTIEGDLTVNTPNATVVNQANVTGTASIQDVADNTFDNSGRLKKLEVTDPNGARIINHKPNLIETFIIDSPAPVELSGVFETVEILQDSFITFAENTTLEELKADENVSVEVIKPKSVEIKVAPTQMKESELQLDDAATLRKIRALIEQLKPYLENKQPDDVQVEQFIQLMSETNTLIHPLYKKDPRGTLVQNLLKDIVTIEKQFMDSIPTPEDLAEAANNFKVEIENATAEEGAYFDFPEVSGDIRFYLSSDYEVSEKYMIPDRPLHEDEVRHVFVAYTFSKNNKHLTQRGYFNIPAGNGEITFTLLEPNKYRGLGDYTTSDSFQLSEEGSYSIEVKEGKTAGDLLDSSLLAESKKEFTLTVVERVLAPITITGDYHLELSKSYNVINNKIVFHNSLDETDPNYVSIGESSGFLFDEKMQTLHYHGEISTIDLQSKFKEKYLSQHPEETEESVHINFVRFLKPEDQLKSGHFLISMSERGHEGTFMIGLMIGE
ncbi:hypothetical protein [Exiguobacterium sp. s162]|uniref:hypothetical protein n=1 Tax=Exiguobacterium sp. s162 TaxID=2751276 RepID=UPI001BEB0E75|nr:hypothetical protein [Exiguobacterium sp. s162]